MKRGRTEIEPDASGKDLYVRIDARLAELLRQRVEAERAAQPGRRTTEADVVRGILYKELGG